MKLTWVFGVFFPDIMEFRFVLHGMKALHQFYLYPGCWFVALSPMGGWSPWIPGWLRKGWAGRVLWHDWGQEKPVPKTFWISTVTPRQYTFQLHLAAFVKKLPLMQHSAGHDTFKELSGGRESRIVFKTATRGFIYQAWSLDGAEATLLCPKGDVFVH